MIIPNQKLILTIDVGNTQCVIACYAALHKGPSQKIWRIPTHPIGTGDEFRNQLETLLLSDDLRFTDIESMTVSSVVPAFTKMLRSALGSTFKLNIIDASWPFSFVIQANPPHQVGVDRLVNAEAAIKEYGYPCIIVDSGTATSICALTQNREGKAVFLGGAIMLGIETSMKALADRAALLFEIDLSPPDSPIGGNTQSALQSGIVLGHASMIDGMVARFKEELKALGDCVRQIPVIATGGNSHLMKGIAHELTHFDPELTLKGIHILHESIHQR